MGRPAGNDSGRSVLSESGPRLSHGGEWLWGGVCPIVPRVPGLIWVLGPWAGDVMVDGSSRGERLRPLGLWWTAARGRESRQLRELAGRLVVVWELWAWRKRSAGGLGDGLERFGAELAQGVKAAAGELARDRQRCPGVREPARLEREVVGAVGAGRPTRRLS
jgi:hypothetical protein